jgi:hypothetical protein
MPPLPSLPICFQLQVFIMKEEHVIPGTWSHKFNFEFKHPSERVFSKVTNFFIISMFLSQNKNIP